MTAHEIHALSGAYAVDALDDEERARFEQHLAACAECRAEVTSLQDATLLLSDLTEVAPPAAVRAKVLADIKNVRPLPPVVVRLERRRPRRWTNLLAAAAVFGVLAGGAVVVEQANQESPTQQPSAADRILRAADVQHFTYDLPNGASATLSRSASEGRAVLVTKKMPAAPAGKVYELWLQDDTGNMIPAGFMTKPGDQTIVLNGDASRATGAGITIEPAGGRKTPTLPTVAVFNFEHAT